ncbi:MAG: hypothetical protein GOV02_03645 [Candidatus Aenigmarchaeota archaeon]|nr:hypothetical protein [Candidatus Aenigmarchaeota archaeon]
MSDDFSVSKMFENIKYMKDNFKCCDHDKKLKPVGGLTYAGAGGIQQMYRCPVEGCRKGVFGPAAQETVDKFCQGIREWKTNV